MRQNALRSSIKSLNAETLSYPIKHRAHIDQMPGRMSNDKTAHGNPPIIANDRMHPTWTSRETSVFTSHPRREQCECVLRQECVPRPMFEGLQ